MPLPTATDVPTVVSILGGLGAVAGVVGYLAGRWWVLLIPLGSGIVLAVLLATSPKEEGSLGLLWWLLLFPAGVVFIGILVGIALRRLIAPRDGPVSRA